MTARYIHVRRKINFETSPFISLARFLCLTLPPPAFLSNNNNNRGSGNDHCVIVRSAKGKEEEEVDLAPLSLLENNINWSKKAFRGWAQKERRLSTNFLRGRGSLCKKNAPISLFFELPVFFPPVDVIACWVQYSLLPPCGSEMQLEKYPCTGCGNEKRAFPLIIPPPLFLAPVIERTWLLWTTLGCRCCCCCCCCCCCWWWWWWGMACWC